MPQGRKHCKIHEKCVQISQNGGRTHIMNILAHRGRNAIKKRATSLRTSNQSKDFDVFWTDVEFTVKQGFGNIKALQSYQVYILLTVSQKTMFKIFQQTPLDAPQSSLFSKNLSIVTVDSLKAIVEEEDFQPTNNITAASRKQLAPKTLNSIMQWFAQKGIVKGTPEDLLQNISSGNLKKTLSQRETPSLMNSQLLQRRLKRKMTIVV